MRIAKTASILLFLTGAAELIVPTPAAAQSKEKWCPPECGWERYCIPNQGCERRYVCRPAKGCRTR